LLVDVTACQKRVIRSHDPFDAVRVLQRAEVREIVILIAWFERYCDIRYDVFSEEYGGESGEALSEFHEYLDTLLEHIMGWARLEKLTDIERGSVKAHSVLQQAFQTKK
jgi:hypothetical protein